MRGKILETKVVVHTSNASTTDLISFEKKVAFHVGDMEYQYKMPVDVQYSTTMANVNGTLIQYSAMLIMRDRKS